MRTPTPSGLGPLLSRRYVASLLGEKPEALIVLAERAETLYSPFSQAKRNDPTKTRQIDNPQNPLKSLQRRIKTRLLDRVPLPPFVVGGVPGRSARQNSALHVGRREVVTLDVREFFPTVLALRIFKMWRRVFRASVSVARLLTNLTTFDGHLPQGCPASNAIANLVVLPLAWELHDLCAASRLVFTIYVDDISISGRAAREILPSVIARIRAHGFAVASRKVHVMPRHARQLVTGNVVNEKLSNGGAKLSELGGRLVRALRAGITAEELLRLQGSVHHAAAIDPRQGERLERLLAQVQQRTALRQAYE